MGKVLEGARGEGVETSVMHLGRMKIAGCMGCAACKKGTGCVLKDDMYRFYAAVQPDMGLVIGTPVYFDHVSAQLKAFIDRMFAFFYPGVECHYPPGGRAAIVLTYGDEADRYTEIVDWIADRLHDYFKVKTVGSVRLASCPDNRLVADHRPDAVAQALALGRTLTQR